MTKEYSLISIQDYLDSGTDIAENLMLCIGMFYELAMMHKHNHTHCYINAAATYVVCDEDGHPVKLQLPDVIPHDSRFGATYLNPTEQRLIAVCNRAPEIETSGIVYDRSDVFCAGSIMYLLLTGKKFKRNKYFDPEQKQIEQQIMEYNSNAGLTEEMASTLSDCLLSVLSNDHLYRFNARLMICKLSEILSNMMK